MGMVTYGRAAGAVGRSARAGCPLGGGGGELAWPALCRRGAEDVARLGAEGTQRRVAVALVLREDDVRAVLTVPDAIDVLQAAFRHQGTGDARNIPRSRVVLPAARGAVHVVWAFVPGQPGHAEVEGPGLVGLKAYTGFKDGVRFAVLLYSGADGRLLALIEADWLGQVRTGAASGLATRYMARTDARVAALIGTGGQARTQALALAAARPLERMLVYGRDAARRRRVSPAAGGGPGRAPAAPPPRRARAPPR